MDNGTSIPSEVSRRNTRLSYFEGIYDKGYDKYDTLGDVLKKIKAGEWKDEVEFIRELPTKKEKDEVKVQLPAVTFSGLFSGRNDKDLTEYSNIIVLDIDDLNGLTYSKTMEYISKTPFIFCAFMSCSKKDEGIKALAIVEDNPKNHKTNFLGIEEYMLNNWGIKVDKSGKNIARLCFVSYDPEMYFDIKSKRSFELQSDAPMTYEQEIVYFRNVQRRSENMVPSTRFDYIIKLAKEWAEKGVGMYHKGNRNNYIFHLCCILNRAGVSKDQAENYMMGTYRSVEQKELMAVVKSAYVRYAHEFNSRPILVKKRNQNKMF